MSSSVASINNVSRQVLIYGGCLLTAVGMLGSCANIYLFTKPRYRHVPCSLFILSGAVFDLVVLCIALLFRIINQIVQYDISAFSIYVCKIRTYVVDICLPLPIWFVVLSTFNRLCITSRGADQRQWCTPARSRIMAGMLFLAFAIYRSPDFHYINVYLAGSRLTCGLLPSDYIYLNLHSYFTFPVLLITLPLVLLTIFTIRIRGNLHMFITQQTASRMEQQLTSMILLQALGAACLVPYVVNFLYATITKFVSKSDYQIAVENLISQIVTLSFYVHYASGFYIYFIASPDVRRSVRTGWQSMRRKLGAANQIAPTTVLSVRGR